MADAGPSAGPTIAGGNALQSPNNPSGTALSYTPPASSGPAFNLSPSQAVIVSSNASRAQHAQNQADFTQAIANRTPPVTTTDISSFTPEQQKAFQQAAPLAGGRAQSFNNATYGQIGRAHV